MHTFLTPDPITIEIRNSSGEIRLDLADVTTTTVEVTASSSHPFGFLDDVFRAVAGGRQSNGARRGFDVRSAEDQDDYHRYGADQDEVDPAERVLVELRDTTRWSRRHPYRRHRPCPAGLALLVRRARHRAHRFRGPRADPVRGRRRSPAWPIGSKPAPRPATSPSTG